MTSHFNETEKRTVYTVYIMTSGMSQFTAHVISHASLNTTTSSLLYWINIPISPGQNVLITPAC